MHYSDSSVDWAMHYLDTNIDDFVCEDNFIIYASTELSQPFLDYGPQGSCLGLF